MPELTVGGAGTSGGATQPATGVIRLLQTIKVPAGYRKVIRGGIQEAPGSPTTMLFTPSLELSTVRLADGVIECREEEFATLIIENHRTEKLRLKRGTVLGTLEAVEEAEGARETQAVVGLETESDGKDQNDTAAHDGTNAVVEDCTYPSGGSRAYSPGAEPVVNRMSGGKNGRLAKLFQQLELDGGQLHAKEERQLKTLLEKHSDIFAVEPSELGTSSVAQHSIKTGDHPPIRQPLRQMPFTLRHQVDKLV